MYMEYKKFFSGMCILWRGLKYSSQDGSLFYARVKSG